MACAVTSIYFHSDLIFINYIYIYRNILFETNKQSQQDITFSLIIIIIIVHIATIYVIREFHATTHKSGIQNKFGHFLLSPRFNYPGRSPKRVSCTYIYSFIFSFAKCVQKYISILLLVLCIDYIYSHLFTSRSSWMHEL